MLLITTARPGAGARRPPGLVVAIDTCVPIATRSCCALPIGRAQRLSLIERAVGIEPGGLAWKASVSTTTRPPATARAAPWRFEQAVGIEPTEAGVAHQPVTLNRLHLSHPLESNQNLSGFGRARRPATPEWELGCLPAPSSSLLFDCQRIARAQGATRAVMLPRATRTHRSRSRSSACSVAVAASMRIGTGSRAGTPARNVEGPPGIPGRPFSTGDALHHLPGEPPGESASPLGPGRNPVPTSPASSRASVRPLMERHDHTTRIARLAASWLCPCRSNTGSSVLRSARLANTAANQTMMRRIAMSNRSVKRFFDEIHNNAWRLAFRRSG